MAAVGAANVAEGQARVRGLAILPGCALASLHATRDGGWSRSSFAPAVASCRARHGRARVRCCADPDCGTAAGTGRRHAHGDDRVARRDVDGANAFDAGVAGKAALTPCSSGRPTRGTAAGARASLVQDEAGCKGVAAGELALDPGAVPHGASAAAARRRPEKRAPARGRRPTSEDETLRFGKINPPMR